MDEDVIKVLVVDDYTLVRQGIISLLHNEIDIAVIGEASNGEEALELTKQHKPHVVLMDIKMPGMGGFEATRRLLNIYPHIKVVILTRCESGGVSKTFLDEGASAYITKDSSLNEILYAIRAVSKGGRYISPKIAQEMVLSRSVFEQLSARELQVAMMVAGGKRVMTIAKILNLSPKTINTYRYRIFDKLNVNNDVELTHLVLQYELLDEDSI